MSFTQLSKLLPAAALSRGMKRQVDAAVICQKFRMRAPAAVHPEVLNYAFPKFVKDKTLTIGVTNAAWGQEIQQKSAALIEAINKEIGFSAIIKIKTSIVEELPNRENMV